MEIYLDFKEKSKLLLKIQEFSTPQDKICPVCDNELYISGHCKTCQQCGWSSCDL